MTLNVSLRVPDGIVLASDSLATLMQQINQKMTVHGNCQKCGEQVEIKDVPTPPMTVPSSTWPYAQKMYPIQNSFGLATWGAGFVNNRSIYNHIIELEGGFPAADGKADHLETMTAFVAAYFRDQLVQQCKRTGIDINLLPDSWLPFGFQLVGFIKDANGDPEPHSHTIKIGKNPVIEKFGGIGCTWSGDGRVVTRLLQPNIPNFGAFSLQDAVDYAKFLIGTTAGYQRFSGTMPTVGGEIDMALITNRRGFRWIAQKELYRILDREEKKI